MKAKEISKLGKILSVVFVVGAFVTTAILKIAVEVWDIILVGAFIMFAVSPIDFSIWLDKLIQIRTGQGGPGE